MRDPSITEQEKAFNDVVVGEILRAKARWMHACYAAILPLPLLEKASRDEDIATVTAWAKAQGYRWREFVGESQLWKGTEMVARFRPVLVKGEDPHVRFEATVRGLPVRTDDPRPTNN